MTYQTYVPMCGDEITGTIKVAQAMAADGSLPVEFKFNGVTVRVAAGSDAELLYRDWRRSLARDTPFVVGPYPAAELSAAEIAEDERVAAENERRRAESRAAYEARMAERTAALNREIAGTVLAVRNDPAARAAYDRWHATNSDDYGQGTLRFATGAAGAGGEQLRWCQSTSSIPCSPSSLKSPTGIPT